MKKRFNTFFRRLKVSVIFLFAIIRKSKRGTDLHNWPKLIGHAQFSCKYPSNSIDLYRYLIEELHFDFVECDVLFTKDNIPVLSHDDVIHVYKKHNLFEVSISKSKFSDLRSFSLYEDRFLPVTSLNELLEYTSRNNKWLMLDLSHCQQTFYHAIIIHKLIKKNKQKDKTLIGDCDSRLFSLLSNHYKIQFEVDYFQTDFSFYTKYTNFFSAVVLSHVFRGESLSEYKGLINNIHRIGLLTKISIVNDALLVNQLFGLGADFIISDVVTPNELIS